MIGREGPSYSAVRTSRLDSRPRLTALPPDGVCGAPCPIVGGATLLSITLGSLRMPSLRPPPQRGLPVPPAAFAGRHMRRTPPGARGNLTSCGNSYQTPLANHRTLSSPEAVRIFRVVRADALEAKPFTLPTAPERTHHWAGLCGAGELSGVVSDKAGGCARACVAARLQPSPSVRSSLGIPLAAELCRSAPLGMSAN
ncbi:hypothetical protein BV25DRAFT_1438358 [Artomyces pyxidatus]|uniref:Uncharacterized protein n=1 Tax=Artomyces pyxidatus TaxID=48021 RepID=A0ACB8SLF1_9AGAM|nr:hypothetical protein BV25DRAFT_1438358 [Artomyces pyxidatus]